MSRALGSSFHTASVKTGSLAQASITSAFGGKADEIGGKADIAIMNVCCWEVSRPHGECAEGSSTRSRRRFEAGLNDPFDVRRIIASSPVTAPTFQILESHHAGFVTPVYVTMT